jgi:predicted nucleic acid-binding protein
MRWLLDSNVLIDALAGLPHGVRVFQEARKRLVRIKIPDALIAASADTAQAVVVTRNTGDFQRVPGLTVVHPDNV